MPPEALFLHSLRCPNTRDLTHLLGSFSSYRNTLELPIEPELNNGDLCFSLGDVIDFGNNFFCNDCPGAVNFSELDAKADEERKGRPSYRPIIDHDGLPRQRLSNQVLSLS
ncbi:U11/U12 small nuclear ribonucleoprotein 48 kDa protein [Raphanus sativus]|nr:U11/U12 small nuclear ribonucleoprotein 48 kDa protein [Raphanus sativus]